MPAARARFERHLAAQRTSTPIAVKVAGPGRFSRMLGGRGMAIATSAAAVGVIAIVALLVLQPFAATETASALTIDDYVQVQGVVATSENGVMTVQSPELGELDVAIDESTAVTDEQGVREKTSLQAGESVLVSGIVTQKRAIAATNVAVAKDQATPQAAANGRIPLLKTLREGLQGTISLFTLSPDGTRARVLIVNANARFLVDVDPKAMDQFLAENPGAIGARVRIVRGAGAGAGRVPPRASNSSGRVSDCAAGHSSVRKRSRSGDSEERERAHGADSARSSPGRDPAIDDHPRGSDSAHSARGGRRRQGNRARGFGLWQPGGGRRPPHRRQPGHPARSARAVTAPLAPTFG